MNLQRRYGVLRVDETPFVNSLSITLLLTKTSGPYRNYSNIPPLEANHTAHPPFLDQVFLRCHRNGLVTTGVYLLDPYPDARHQLDEVDAQAFAERSLTIETQHRGSPLFDHLAPISLGT